MSRKIIGFITITLTLLAAFTILKRSDFFKPEIIEVPIPVESLGLYDDMAILALDIGDLEVAGRYIDKSGNTQLLDRYQKHKEVKALVLEAVEKGFKYNQRSKTEVEAVFKRLVSVESLDETLDGDQDVALLLLLVQMSAESGFKSWDSIAKRVEMASLSVESSNPELSVVLHEMSQYRINV